MDLHPEIRRLKSGGCRRGDVLLLPTAKPPKRGKAESNPVLAHGEATGHHHTLYNRVAMFRDDAMTVATIGADTPLRHQEHSGFQLKPGHYEAIRQVEYDLMEGARQVAD